VVVGVADHTGWAFLVSAAVVNGVPTVVDRRRVKLIDEGLPSQPYEHDTVALLDADAEQLLRKVKRSAAACSARAFQHLATDLGPRYRITAITMREPSLERLPATIEEARRSYHLRCRADGVLYHTAICTAARERGWAPVFHRRGDELARAAEALQASAEDVEQFISDLGRTLKPPWSAEHRTAFAAAIGRLKKESRLGALTAPERQSGAR